MEIRGLTILNQLAFDFIKKFIYYKTILSLVLFSIALFSSAFAQDPCAVIVSPPQYMDQKTNPGMARSVIEITDPILSNGDWNFSIFYNSGTAFCEGGFRGSLNSTQSSNQAYADMPMDCWRFGTSTLLFRACNNNTGECVECVLAPRFRPVAGSNTDKSPTINNGVISYENDSNIAVDINIVSITGQTIHSENVAAHSSATFELKNTNSAGMYFMQVMQQGNLLSIQKIIAH